MQHRKRHHLFCCSFVWGAVRKETSMRVFYFLSCVVFVVEGADEVIEKSAKVGDDVTLEPDDADVQGADNLVWRIRGETSVIANFDREISRISIINDERFRGRVQMDETTGSLTIMNINTADSGVYELEINSRVVKTKIFSLSVHPVDDIVEVSVMEGDSVSLNINDKVEEDEELNWRVKPKDENVFKSIRDVRFKEGETGSLTITNINIKDSGLYGLESSSMSIDVRNKARFNVTVHGVFSDETDGVKTVSKKTGTDVHLDTHMIGLQKDDLIEWTFGPQNISIAKTDGKSQNKIYNYNDERFRNRMYLQIETGDLTISDASSEHSGLYQLKIINNTFTIQKRFSVSVSDAGLSSDVVTLVVGGVLVALLVAAAVVICYQCIINSKLKKQIAQRRLSESNSGSGLMRRINSI